MLRHRLTDEQWELIADLSPKPKRSGRSPRDRRQIVDGILWILRTGSTWRDLLQEFGPWATVWDLFDKWNADGTLQAILNRVRGEVDIHVAKSTIRTYRIGRQCPGPQTWKTFIDNHFDDIAAIDFFMVVPPENSIRVAYRAFGATAPAFYSLAYIGDVPCAGVTCVGDTAS